MNSRALVLVIFSIASLAAQSPDSATLPLLQLNDLKYAGGFRVPRDAGDTFGFGFGGGAIAFNPSGGLYITSRRSRIAEISIPALAQTGLADLPIADYRQRFVDVLGERYRETNPVEAVGIGGLLVADDRLRGAVTTYYDGSNAQRRTHFAHPLSLNPVALTGFSQTWIADRQGYVSGPMAAVPAEWHLKLGGTAIVCQFGVPVVSRTSMGPCAFAVKAAELGQPTVAAIPLLYYDGRHPTIGSWDNSTAINERYSQSTTFGGMVIASGTRTALYFGRTGIGVPCYGTGSGDKSLTGTAVGDGSKYCFDPTDSSKGTHGYPYRSQIWAYDLNDFAAVKAGKKQPWDPQPYGVWTLTLPDAQPDGKIGGVTIDLSRNRIYVSQMNADKVGLDGVPVIRAFDVRVGAR